MSLANIIPSMKYELVKASIASLFLTERTNQLALLAAAEISDDVIANDYYFNIFKDLYRLPDASELPAINIYNVGGDFGQGSGRNYLDSKWHTYRLAVDCYAVSCAEEDYSSDKLAAERLDYLFAQAHHILGSEENFHKGLKSIVRTSKMLSWEQKRWNQPEVSAETFLSIQALFELQFEEPTEIVSGVPLEEIVASLEIDEQFISPFITRLIV